ncbi:MAG: hypothetical protein Kow0062_26280 [Acidobacteriota bacterium]
MKRDRRTRCTTTRIAAAITVSAALAVQAFAGSLEGRLHGPIVIGDQLFVAERIELVEVGVGTPLIAVVLDGRQVALCERHTKGTPPSGAQAVLVTARDEWGYEHLVGIEFRRRGSDDPATARRLLRPVQVERGVATVGPRQTEPVLLARGAR